jgi:hypothetical protein
VRLDLHRISYKGQSCPRDWIGDDVRTDAKKIRDSLANNKDHDSGREADDDRARKHSDACSEANCAEKYQETAR